jgi:hypothetical protein
MYRERRSEPDEAVFLDFAVREQLPPYVVGDLVRWYMQQATSGPFTAETEAAFRERFTGPLTEAQINRLISWERSASEQ